MRTAKKTVTKQLDLTTMLESIRWNHINIELIIKEEIKTILPQFIEDIVKSVYENLEAK